MTRRAVRKDSFYKTSMYYAGASLIASIINYLMYPLLSRVLAPSDLGDVGVISAITVQAGSILLAFNIVSIYVVARETSESAVKKLEVVQSQLIRLSFVVSLFLIALMPAIKNLLNIGSYYTLLVLAFLLVAIIPTVTWTGYLQGNKQLPLVGLYNIMNAVMKVSMAVLFSLIGFKAAGAVFGIFLGYLSGLILLKVRSPLPLPSLLSIFRRQGANITNLRPLIVNTLGVSVVLAALYSFEFACAKFFFDAHSAGYYIGSLTLASSAFYAVATLMWIVLPHYAPTDEAHNKKLLLKAVFVGAVGTLFLSALFYVFGERISVLALGQEYGIISDIIWRNTLSQGVIAILTMVLFSHLVRGKKRVLLNSLLLSIPVFTAVAVVRPDSYQQLANTMLMGELLGITVMCVGGAFQAQNYRY